MANELFVGRTEGGVAASNILRDISILAICAQKRLLADGDTANAWSAYLLADQSAAVWESVERTSTDRVAAVDKPHSPEIGALLQRLKHDREDTVKEARRIAFEAIGDVLPKNTGVLARVQPFFHSEAERRLRFKRFTSHMCEYSFDNFIAALDYLESVVDG